MWLIRRTKPIGTFSGYAIPVFIRNWDYHLTTVDVYGDGAIDAWGFLDRDLFDVKLKKGWVWPQPPNGGRLSIFNLGCCTARDSCWTHTPTSFRACVHNTIKKLNPTLKDLLDMHGSDVELRGKVRHAKLGCGDKRPCHIGADGAVVLGKEVPAFQMINGVALLTQVFVFSDGLARIGSHCDLVPIEEVYRRFYDGRITTSVANGMRVEIQDLGSFICERGSWFVEPPERVRELRGILDELNGRPALIRQCVSSHGNYLKDPSAQNLAALRCAYEAVPKHLRTFCGDMDSKDHPIRRILFPHEYGLE